MESTQSLELDIVVAVFDDTSLQYPRAAALTASSASVAVFEVAFGIAVVLSFAFPSARCRRHQTRRILNATPYLYIVRQGLSRSVFVV